MKNIDIVDWKYGGSVEGLRDDEMGKGGSIAGLINEEVYC